MSDVLKSLGLEGAVEVSVDDWKQLPTNRRHSLTGPPPEHTSVFLRLPDPAPVAALRWIENVADDPGTETDLLGLVAQVWDVARAALAEFDGTTS